MSGQAPVRGPGPSAPLEQLGDDQADPEERQRRRDELHAPRLLPQQDHPGDDHHEHLEVREQRRQPRPDVADRAMPEVQIQREERGGEHDGAGDPDEIRAGAAEAAKRLWLRL